MKLPIRLPGRLRAWISNIRSHERGNALVVCAATLPLLIGSAAIGVDTVQVSVSKRQLQRAADSAALAGVYAKAQTHTVATAVNHDLTQNNDIPLSGAPVIENAPTAGSYAGNIRAVRVILTAQRTLPFVSFFTGAPMTVRAEATAAQVYQGQYCMVSLETENVTGISFGGNTTVDLGCGVVSNSRSTQAVVAGGSSSITASPIAAVGGVPASGSYASGTELMPYTISQADPYSGLPQPTVPANCQNQSYNVQPNDSSPAAPVASSAGVYCYRGMDIKGTVTLPAGTYIIDRGGLSFGAQSNVTCSGCVFILTSATAGSQPSSISDVSINGGAIMNLTAPSSGPYAGVLMYMDRRAPYGTSTINGNSSSIWRGGFYFPTRELRFNGTAGMQTECIQMVARRLDLRGNSSISNTCPTDSGTKAFDALIVRLVA